jgi:protein CWC15
MFSKRYRVCIACSHCSTRGRDDDEDDEDEDDSAELLRELEKIKRERAAEKERQEREQTASSAAAREAEIATANPLLNLAAALGQNPHGVNTTVPGTFAVKRRWDDGKLPCIPSLLLTC